MSRSTPLTLTALALAGGALAPALAAAQAPAPGLIVAVGTANVTVSPVDRKSDASIKKALDDAQAAALPLAIKAARARAVVLAAESGLNLGDLVGIGDQAASPFGPFNYYGIDGTFGPGRYCGNVARYKTTRLASGRVLRKRIGTRRQCRFPNRVGTSVSVTYKTGA